MYPLSVPHTQHHIPVLYSIVGYIPVCERPYSVKLLSAHHLHPVPWNQPTLQLPPSFTNNLVNNITICHSIFDNNSFVPVLSFFFTKILQISFFLNPPDYKIIFRLDLFLFWSTCLWYIIFHGIMTALTHLCSPFAFLLLYFATRWSP